MLVLKQMRLWKYRDQVEKDETENPALCRLDIVLRLSLLHQTIVMVEYHRSFEWLVVTPRHTFHVPLISDFLKWALYRCSAF